MAGPYTGTWRASIVSDAEYTGALKWGTGINPVHSLPGPGPNISRYSNLNIDPITTPGGQETNDITPDFSWDSTWNPNPEQPEENVTPSELWGYNSETGVANRPEWGTGMADPDAPYNAGGLPNPQRPGRPLTPMRATSQNDTGDPYPSWGGSRKTKPAGWKIRIRRRGSDMATSARGLPLEDVAQGWTNKNTGIPADARTSDPSQYEMQTSMTQRYKTRAGSQREGSQSTQEAPIDSRVVGQKLKTYTDLQSPRHWDMLPYEQNDYIRPFLTRQAGTGWQEWATVNEMYQSPVIQREPAPDPELGPVAGSLSQDDYAYDYSGGYY